MLKRRLSLGALIALLFLALMDTAWAHHPDHNTSISDDGNKARNRNLLHDTDLPDGHVPANTNYGFVLIGHDQLGGIFDGKYTDVWSHKGYAYVGTFEEPTCDRSGVYISDIRVPSDPQTITMIKSPPQTRINDVKVHEIGGKDVLIFTLEKCGPIVGSNSIQRGQGGVSLWDVTDPFKPHALKQNLLDFQVHNTFPWTADDGHTYLLIVDDEHLNDVQIADITKPQSPKLITTTGIGDWIFDGVVGSVTGTTVDADGQLFTGAFATPLLHDIWVNQAPDGRWLAVLSYWDAGFIVLDVTDPYNPVFQGDSIYPDPDPVLGNSPAEGNAHAAVFGGADLEYIFGGDEDFDSLRVTVKADGNTFIPTQGSDVPLVGSPGVPEVVGPTVFVGQACGAVSPAASGTIAMIERGTCAFTTKAQNVEAAGYVAGIVFNQPGRGDGASCEVSVSMLVSAGIPMLFLPRSAGFAILDVAGYDPSLCSDDPAIGDGANPPLPAIGVAGLDVDISADFDGWGYLHVLNNLEQDVMVPHPDGDRTVGYLEEIGYYAPAELADAVLATGAGDLTMHNIEADPLTQDVVPSSTAGPRMYISWYSLGMRAAEHRPGHYHDNSMGEGVFSWNVHEVGRWIAKADELVADLGISADEAAALEGSNFWGVHVTEIDGTQYILGSDRNTGLWIFAFECFSSEGPLYCQRPPGVTREGTSPPDKGAIDLGAGSVWIGPIRA